MRTSRPDSFIDVAKSDSAIVFDGLSDATRGLSVWSTAARVTGVRRPASRSLMGVWTRVHRAAALVEVHQVVESCRGGTAAIESCEADVSSWQSAMKASERCCMHPEQRQRRWQRHGLNSWIPARPEHHR